MPSESMAFMQNGLIPRIELQAKPIAMTSGATYIGLFLSLLRTFPRVRAGESWTLLIFGFINVINSLRAINLAF